jgi:U3 small nucleolar RNA-associated protein 10
MEDQLKNIHLTENSLSFYRGTKTKEQLVEIDSDMESLLLTLSPHLMLPASHKIVEYLIRIYEVHAHLKHSFIMMFLPYFETPYFLKAIQLVNLENDEYFAFMHQFAYQGEAISKKIIVKAFKRNNAIVFKKYSDWLLTS